MRGDVARLGRCTAICTQGEDTIKRSKPFKYTYEKEIVMQVPNLAHLNTLPSWRDVSGMRISRSWTIFRRSAYILLMPTVGMRGHSSKTSRLRGRALSLISYILEKLLKWGKRSRPPSMCSVSSFTIYLWSAVLVISSCLFWLTFCRILPEMWIHVE